MLKLRQWFWSGVFWAFMAFYAVVSIAVLWPISLFFDLGLDVKPRHILKITNERTGEVRTEQYRFRWIRYLRAFFVGFPLTSVARVTRIDFG